MTEMILIITALISPLTAVICLTTCLSRQKDSFYITVQQKQIFSPQEICSFSTLLTADISSSSIFQLYWQLTYLLLLFFNFADSWHIFFFYFSTSLTADLRLLFFNFADSWPSSSIFQLRWQLAFLFYFSTLLTADLPLLFFNFADSWKIFLWQLKLKLDS